MSSIPSMQRIYGARLSRWTRIFARGSSDLRPSEIDRDSDLAQVQLFVSENFQKRAEKIAALTGLLEESFDRYYETIDEFMRSVPAQPCAPSRADAFRYLEWLTTQHALTSEQRDCLICERSRLRVEELACRRRLDYVRFAELWSIVDAQLGELTADSDRRLVVNPTGVWALLATRRFVGDSTPLPATVLFLAVEEDHRTCLLEQEGCAIIRRLEGCPATISELQRALPAIPQNELAEHCRQLAEQGILAIQ